MKDHMNKDELNQQLQNLDNKVKFLIDKGVSIKKRSHFNLLVIFVFTCFFVYYIESKDYSFSFYLSSGALTAAWIEFIYLKRKLSKKIEEIANVIIEITNLTLKIEQLNKETK